MGMGCNCIDMRRAFVKRTSLPSEGRRVLSVYCLNDRAHSFSPPEDPALSAGMEQQDVETKQSSDHKDKKNGFVSFPRYILDGQFSFCPVIMQFKLDVRNELGSLNSSKLFSQKSGFQKFDP